MPKNEGELQSGCILSFTTFCVLFIVSQNNLKKTWGCNSKTVVQQNPMSLVMFV